MGWGGGWLYQQRGHCRQQQQRDDGYNCGDVILLVAHTIYNEKAPRILREALGHDDKTAGRLADVSCANVSGFASLCRILPRLGIGGDVVACFGYPLKEGVHMDGISAPIARHAHV